MKYDRVQMVGKPIPVKLDQALLDRIIKVSNRMGEARSTVMRMAMRLGLDTIEAALKIKPAILNDLVLENRPADSPYPSHSSQHVAMNEPSSVQTKDSPGTGHGDTERLGKGMVAAIQKGAKPKKAGPA